MLDRQDLRNILVWFDYMEQHVLQSKGRIGKTHHKTEAKILELFNKESE